METVYKVYSRDKNGEKVLYEGEDFDKGEAVLTVTGAKGTLEVIAPAAGMVQEINEAAQSQPLELDLGLHRPAARQNPSLRSCLGSRCHSLATLTCRSR